MKEPPKVGQTVYSLNVGNAAGRNREQKLTPMVVSSVGKKYFRCRYVGWEDLNGAYEVQVRLNNWYEKTDFCCDHHFYSTEQEWLDEKESDGIRHELWKAFEYGGNPRNVNLETLRKIKELIP